MWNIPKEFHCKFIPILLGYHLFQLLEVRSLIHQELTEQSAIFFNNAGFVITLFQNFNLLQMPRFSGIISIIAIYSNRFVYLFQGIILQSLFEKFIDFEGADIRHILIFLHDCIHFILSTMSPQILYLLDEQLAQFLESE